MSYAAEDDNEFPDSIDIDDQDSADASVDTITCPKCRRVIYAQTERCPQCGEYIDANTTSSRPPLWIIIVAGICIVVIVFFWIR